MATIREADGRVDIDEIRTLFEEYAQSLGVDLSFQDFGVELAGLPGAYASPGGRLLLAVDGTRPVGCVGVRPLGDGICEMKRLYVRPEARGQGLGRELTQAAIAFGRAAGYRAMRRLWFQTQRNRVQEIVTCQVATIAPNHTHKSRAIEAMQLAFLRLIHILWVQPRDAEIIIEVGSLFTLPILERPIRSVAGDL